MKNGEISKKFLNSVTATAKAEILRAIAKHYGTSAEEIYEEVTGEDAEHLLDYVTGAERSATSVLMQKHGFR